MDRNKYYNRDYPVSQQEVSRLKDRGYKNVELLPLPKEKRNSSLLSFFTLWMGPVHSLTNFMAVSACFLLGLPVAWMMVGMLIAGVVLAYLFANNGRPGSKYGIPFSMHMRSTYGDLGARLPGFIRGGLFAIPRLGLMTYLGSRALLALISSVWPGFLNLWAGETVLGTTAPVLISFTLYWLVSLLLGLGGIDRLNQFNRWLGPVIVLVLGGAGAWVLDAFGGWETILSFQMPAGELAGLPLLWRLLVMVVSLIAVWGAPLTSISEFTRDASSTSDQMQGQSLSFIISYICFTLVSVLILVGAALMTELPIHELITLQVQQWQASPLLMVLACVILLTTLSSNIAVNIIPAANQLEALFPDQLTFKNGVVVATVLAFMILPWNLIYSLPRFLTYVGAFLGPMAGVMMAHYFYVNERVIHIDELFFERGQESIYRGINWPAYAATILAAVLSLAGEWLPSLAFLSQIGWLVGFIAGGLIYIYLTEKSHGRVVGVLDLEEFEEKDERIVVKRVN